MSTRTTSDELAHQIAVEEAVRYIREHLDGGTAEIRRWSIGVLMADYDRRGEELAGYDAQAQKWVHNELARLRRQRDAVLALHQPEPIALHGGRVVQMCSHCNTGDPYCNVSDQWPCPTVTALGGGS